MAVVTCAKCGKRILSPLTPTEALVDHLADRHPRWWARHSRLWAAAYLQVRLGLRTSTWTPREPTGAPTAPTDRPTPPGKPPVAHTGVRRRTINPFR